MKRIYGKEEMRELYKLVTGLTPERSDCTIELTDGIELDGLIDAKLRMAYTELLRETAYEELGGDEVKEFGEIRRGSNGLGEIELAEGTVRVFEIELEGWERAARVEGAERLRAFQKRIDNSYSAGTPSKPLAVMGEDGRRVYVHPLMTAKVKRAQGVSDPGEGSYRIEEMLVKRLFERVKIELP